MDFFVYILECSDGSFYTGLTTDLAKRIFEHQKGFEPFSYTFLRRPVVLRWSARFERESEARSFERQVKGWSRAKKMALISGGTDAVHHVVSNQRKKRGK